jgi:hypothetical protein
VGGGVYNSWCSSPALYFLKKKAYFYSKFAFMPSQTIPQPFTNLQLELLKLYARDVPEQDLLEIKRLLAQYFIDKSSDLADKVWDEKGLSEGDILAHHKRTPYIRKETR